MPKAFSIPQAAICRPHWWEILCLLKASMGMPVKEISGKVGMSYMGVRQHLDSMEREKLVEGVRRALKIGRPEKLYRLTERGQDLFRSKDSGLLGVFLDEASSLFDSNAPEKLLLQYFDRLRDDLSSELMGDSLIEKATDLARIRNAGGYHSVCLYDKKDGLRIEEYHHPLGALLKRFPAVAQHEKTLIERVLGTSVKRSEAIAGTHSQVRWDVPTV